MHEDTWRIDALLAARVEAYGRATLLWQPLTTATPIGMTVNVCPAPAELMLLQVLKRLPNLKKLDGIPVDVDERDQALQARGPASSS